MSSTDYQPIACARHEMLEFAVLRRQKLRIELADAAGGRLARVVWPTDVVTRDGAEWLNYRAEDGEGVVRLDRILAFAPEPA
jgi:Rho-binding antiterminator